MIMRTVLPLLCSMLLLIGGRAVVGGDAEYRSHPPMRPLPMASSRPRDDGPARFVEARRGDDANAGSEASPWRTLQHAVDQLQPGQTLYLRGGVYYEHVVARCSGTAERPITIRGFPGEVAIVDGGLREFFDQPESAWEPCPDGVPGEFRSTRVYPELGGDATRTNLLGNFGDSMVPLHGYRFLTDLRSDNLSFAKFDGAKTAPGSGIYCGPGVFYDVTTGRIHARLAKTDLAYLGDDNYRGETDPRRLPLVIAGHAGGPALTLLDSRHVRLRDLVVRGAREATLSVENCRCITLDGLSVYGGSSALRVAETQGLRAVDCAFRGIAAPWTFRGHLKYRAIEARIVSASDWSPSGFDNRDFEFAYCEFTDCVDGVFVGNVHGVRIHYSVLDNVSDDGIFLTAGTAYDGTTPGGDVQITQNYLARCLTTFAFGVGHGRQKATPAGKQTGSGVYIARNVFDFRRPVPYHQPDEDASEVTSMGRLAGDHGGPAWEPLFLYHNTLLHRDPPWRGYYGSGMGGHMGAGTSRRVFNNLFFVFDGPPGMVLPSTSVDFQADGNLHWSPVAEAAAAESGLRKFHASPAFQESQTGYAPGWTAHDRVADPELLSVARDWRAPLDLSISAGSPCVDAGVGLPSRWPDPLRGLDQGKPDIGALSSEMQPWQVGVQGRLSVFGDAWQGESAVAFTPAPFDPDSLAAPAEPVTSLAAILRGYPAFDGPLLEFALRRAGMKVEVADRRWIEPADYSNYKIVAIVGDLARAGVQPTRYGEEDLANVRRFLEGGGTLLLMRNTASIFATDPGRNWLKTIVGETGKAATSTYSIQQPDHPSLAHLDDHSPLDWMNANGNVPLAATRGDTVIGNDRSAILYDVRVGKGRLIYVGWELARSLPHGRKPSSVEAEQAFETQMRILIRLVEVAP